MTRLILAMFLSLSLPHLAAAHSPLLSSSPADGEAVAAAPDALKMRFKGRARLVRFTLSGEAAGDIALGRDHLMIESQTHSITLPNLAADDYQVRWRAMSADGHVIKGGLSFTIHGK